MITDRTVNCLSLIGCDAIIRSSRVDVLSQTRVGTFMSPQSKISEFFSSKLKNWSKFNRKLEKVIDGGR